MGTLVEITTHKDEKRQAVTETLQTVAEYQPDEVLIVMIKGDEYRVTTSFIDNATLKLGMLARLMHTLNQEDSEGSD